LANRPPVKKDMKERLIKEAGMKCANPGCTNYRVHIHHIREWAIYKTHDEKHMIAICPACHDEVHYGVLKIDDATVYRWKNIKRTKNNRDQLIIEPDLDSKLLLGTINVTGPSGVTVFELSNSNKLGFKLVDGDIFLMNLSIRDLNNEETIKVVENHVKYKLDEKIEYTRRNGRIKITTSNFLDFIPLWALPKMLSIGYSLEKGILTLLDVEVMEPGLVKVKGLWSDNNQVVLITDEAFSFIFPYIERPLTFAGGENTTLRHMGKVSKSLFGFK